MKADPMAMLYSVVESIQEGKIAEAQIDIRDEIGDREVQTITIIVRKEVQVINVVRER